MHTPRWISPVLLLTLMGSVRADEPKKVLYNASVTPATVYVWSRPSNSSEVYPTNELRRGDLVEVVEELPNGWLAVVPPEGSFSWIQSRFVKQLSPQEETLWVVVTHPEAPVSILMGTDIEETKPTIIGARLSRGTLLRSIAPPQDPGNEGQTWLPVEPPPSEVRYVQKAAVQRSSLPVAKRKDPVEAVLKNNNPPPTERRTEAAPRRPEKTNDFRRVSATGNRTPLSTGGNPLWLEARRAEEDGQYEKATRLYWELGRKVIQTDHALAMQAYNRAQHLENRYGRPRDNPSPSREPARSPEAVRRNRAVSGYRTLGPGTLKLAGLFLHRQRAYALESADGKFLTYVISEGRVNLRQYRNRKVEVIGEVRYRSDMRSRYVVADQIKLVR